MSDAFVLDIGKQAILTALSVSAPILIVSMLVGLLISIFQAVTQIQEQTLTFVPKMIAIIIILLILGPWMMKVIVQFTQNMLSNITYITK
ncbi:flagellar biosynthesis protein FliQ [Fervidicella metallireducens AeB]|uniref:Flagellar biosynthetic protein FliQ n=1 Tax=Fervidicella metallireducens AeB TaxID=1403537 RepID=A0A017RW09_9CLOT|nr:flagellar biosynthesis protein FliQ [Fervidicella metallireducens]EYE88806.1 flagellar biosynthesis protein FliQ [Fervidicella metallireducens AeB]